MVFQRDHIIAWNLDQYDKKGGNLVALAQHWMLVVVTGLNASNTMIIHYGMNGINEYQIELLQDALDRSDRCIDDVKVIDATRRVVSHDYASEHNLDELFDDNGNIISNRLEIMLIDWKKHLIITLNIVVKIL